MARITSDVIEGFNQRRHTAMALIDLERAFDRVWPAGLLYKLIKGKYPPYLIHLLASYFEGNTGI